MKIKLIRFVIFTSLFICFLLPTFSQPTKVDSLFKAINQIKKLNAEAELQKEAQELSELQRNGMIIFNGFLAILLCNRYRLKKKSSNTLAQEDDEIEKQNLIIQISLGEKENLLREIHHRVKNNLQIISSLLNTQSVNIQDKNVLASIQEGQSRVQAMSLIHQNSYQSEHLNNVGIENSLQELVVYLSNIFAGEDKYIEVIVDAKDINFDLDTAMMLEKNGYEIVVPAMDFEKEIEILEVGKPDLILLDVNLGGKKDGIDSAKEINKKYDIPFIFSTSFTDGATIEHAKEVKPLEQEQLYTAIEIAMFNLAKQPEKSKTEIEEESISQSLFIKDAFFIKEKFKYTKLPIADILWIKAEGNYLEIYLFDRRELIRTTMTAFLEKLDRTNFFRTHKSYAVNLDYLTKFELTTVTILETEIPISKTYADELLKRMEVI